MITIKVGYYVENKENFSTHLYFIRDRLSGVPITSVIQSLNDTVAVRGFISFMKAREKASEEAEQPAIGRLEYELVHVCELDNNYHVVFGSDLSDYRVVTRGDRAEEYLEESLNGLRGE